MRIRPYLPEDGSATLDVFLRAVRETASRDYGAREIAAWAPDDLDPDAWARKRAAADTRVALIGNQVAGFIDLAVGLAEPDAEPDAGLADRRADSDAGLADRRADSDAGLADDGHIDMLFVHPAFGRRGVASALVESVLADARGCGLRALTADVSLTARPFFERVGFEVVEEQSVERDGVFLTRFRMRRAVG